MLLPPDSSGCAEHLDRARIAAKKSAYSTAAREFTAAADACPNREQILLSVGQMQFLSGDTPAAERTLRQARYSTGSICSGANLLRTISIPGGGGATQIRDRC